MNKTTMRTCGCGDVTESYEGKVVTLCGWTQRSRNLGALQFIALRDRSGLVQVVIDEDADEALRNTCAQIKNEYVLRVTGLVRLRAERDINPDMKTGRIEIAAQNVEIISESAPLPFHVDDKVKVSDELRMKYRYLDLFRRIFVVKFVNERFFAGLQDGFKRHLNDVGNIISFYIDAYKLP